MPSPDIAPIQASIEIAAPVAEVWHRISDLTNMRRWSPQNVRTVVLGGRGRKGSRFVNLNHRGPLVWPSWGTIVELDPQKRLVFRIDSNKTVWSYELHPLPGGGTGVVQRREAPDGIGRVAGGLTDVFMGGSDQFTCELEAGMQRTLEAIKAELEG